MRVWGIFATILFLGFAGLSGYLYYERDSLTSDQNKMVAEKEEAEKKLAKVTSDLQVLDQFVSKEFAGSPTESEKSEISDKIKELNSRNVSVAYENYSGASSKEKLTVSQVFFSEYLGLLLEDVNAEATADNNQNQDESQDDLQNIEGEGDYSDNVFP